MSDTEMPDRQSYTRAAFKLVFQGLGEFCGRTYATGLGSWVPPPALQRKKILPQTFIYFCWFRSNSWLTSSRRRAS
jgi:hypothetical protein